MYNDHDEERKDFSDIQFKPPAASDLQQEVPCPQENINQSIPAAAPGSPAFVAQSGSPAPVSTNNASYATPTGVSPIAPDSAAFAAPRGASPAAPDSAAFAVPRGASAVAPNSVAFTAQGGRFVEPAPDNIPQQQRMFAFRGYYQQGDRPPYAQRDESWREPSYSPSQESITTMYTPGISVGQPYSNRRIESPPPEQKSRKNGGFAGRLLRAACLIVLCIALSGVAAFGVMEDWFGLPYSRISSPDDSAPVINQVVLGGTNPNSQRNDVLPSSVAANGMNMSAEDIYEMACNQVVGIRTEMTNTGGYFGLVQGSTVVSGSGFIISSDGYVLTNFHVVETAYLRDLPLVVTLHDGTEFDASVIGYEASNDVALIKIEASGLNAAVIANSDNVRVGQPVYAIGNPFGDLVYTMTEGIVSALDRIVTVEQKSINAFQFSAAVNSGNSGGPVYDTNGEVIGIVSAKIMGESAEGIGFAIPINDAVDIASELIEHGYITGRPLIGITVESVTAAQADYFDMVVGAYVLSVTPGSAAEKAGIKKGDIITALGDTELDSREALLFTLRKYKAGDTETLSLWRTGEEITVTVTFDENLAAGQPQRAQTEPDQPDRSQQQKQPNTRVLPPSP